MAIQIPQGYIVTAPEAIDNRLVLSKAQMRNLSRDENSGRLPIVYFCICSDPEGDGSFGLYIYNRYNTPDWATTGRYRAYSGAWSTLTGKPIAGKGIDLDKYNDPDIPEIALNIGDYLGFNSEGALEVDPELVALIEKLNEELQKKQDKLIAKEGILLNNSEISVAFDKDTIILNSEKELAVNRILFASSEELRALEKKTLEELAKVNSELGTLELNLTSEATRAKKAEADLLALLDSEKVARIAGDSELDAALIELSGKFGSEVEARKAKDEELEALLDSEERARRLGDSELRRALGSERTLRELADLELQAFIDSELARIDSELALKQNLLIASDGIILDGDVISVDIMGVLPEVSGQGGKALTVTSEGTLIWSEGGKVDGLDVVEGAAVHHMLLENKIIKLNIGDGLDFGSEGVEVDLMEVLPEASEGDAGKFLAIDSEGNLFWSGSGGTPDWDQNTQTEKDFIKHRPAIAKDSSSSSLAPDRNTGVKIGDITYNNATGDYSVAEGYHTRATGNYAHAEGWRAIASGEASHAEGQGTIASNTRAHAEGFGTIASGNNSHAEGGATLAKGQESHAEGSGTITSEGADYSHAEGEETETRGQAAHAEGYRTLASGLRAHAEGSQTTASGDYSHTEGQNTIARGSRSHAEGRNTTARGLGSHTEGYLTITSEGANYAHAEGEETLVLGRGAHAEGRYAVAEGNYSHAEGAGDDLVDYPVTAIGFAAHAEGYQSRAEGEASHAEGYSGAFGDGSHAEGMSTAEGPLSHAEGTETRADDDSSHAEGYQTVASAFSSHAEGFQTIASGETSHAEGSNTTASGNISHAEGARSVASGNASHAEGAGQALGVLSHAEGGRYVEVAYSNGPIARGEASHAEGAGTEAIGDYSHAEGQSTIATGNNQHVQGQFNVRDTAENYADIVGWGTSDGLRKNISSLTTSGDLHIKQDFYFQSDDDGQNGYKLPYTVITTTGTGAKTLDLAKRDHIYIYPGPITSLTVTAIENTQAITDIIFTAGTSITVNLPTGVKKPADFAFEPNKTYEINILNNLALIGEWE